MEGYHECSITEKTSTQSQYPGGKFNKVMLNVDKQKLAILKPTGPQTSHHLPRAIFNYVAYGKDASYPEVLLQGLLAKSMD